MKILTKVIYMQSMNIYLGTMENLGTFEGIVGALIVLGTYKNPERGNT
jgi:hypothetical protein